MGSELVMTMPVASWVAGAVAWVVAAWYVARARRRAHRVEVARAWQAGWLAARGRV